MIKVYQTMEIMPWEAGRGIICCSDYPSEVIEVEDELLLPGAAMDFSWWLDEWFEDLSEDEIRAAYERTDDVDVQITVKFYRADYDPGFDDDEPLASWSIWESEILKDYLDSM